MDAASDASSDWDDWADAMVAQGQPPDDTAVPTGGSSSGDCLEEGPEAAEEEAWVRSMVEQGSDGSVVQGVGSRAWDYVLQMAVEGDARASHEWVRLRLPLSATKVTETICSGVGMAFTWITASKVDCCGNCCAVIYVHKLDTCTLPVQ